MYIQKYSGNCLKNQLQITKSMATFKKKTTMNIEHTIKNFGVVNAKSLNIFILSLMSSIAVPALYNQNNFLIDLC